MQPLTHWADELLACEDARVPGELFDRIVSLGEGARRRLIEISTDPAYRGPSAEGGGSAPFHALEILGVLPADDATAARLVESLAADVEDTDVVDALIDSLVAQGEAATPHLIAALDAAGDEHTAGYVAEALAYASKSDDALAALLRAFERHPHTTCDTLAQFGDARALPALRAAVASRFVGAGSPVDSDRFVLEACESIEELGSDLTATEAKKRDLALRRAERRMARDEARHTASDREDARLEAPARPAPNDPCPCGSGRKFKKCHEGDEGALP